MMNMDAILPSAKGSKTLARLKKNRNSYNLLRCPLTNSLNAEIVCYFERLECQSTRFLAFEALYALISVATPDQFDLLIKTALRTGCTTSRETHKYILSLLQIIVWRQKESSIKWGSKFLDYIFELLGHADTFYLKELCGNFLGSCLLIEAIPIKILLERIHSSLKHPQRDVRTSVAACVKYIPLPSPLFINRKIFSMHSLNSNKNVGFDPKEEVLKEISCLLHEGGISCSITLYPPNRQYFLGTKRSSKLGPYINLQHHNLTCKLPIDWYIESFSDIDLQTLSKLWEKHIVNTVAHCEKLMEVLLEVLMAGRQGMPGVQVPSAPLLQTLSNMACIATESSDVRGSICSSFCAACPVIISHISMLLSPQLNLIVPLVENRCDETVSVTSWRDRLAAVGLIAALIDISISNDTLSVLLHASTNTLVDALEYGKRDSVKSVRKASVAALKLITRFQSSAKICSLHKSGYNNFIFPSAGSIKEQKAKKICKYSPADSEHRTSSYKNGRNKGSVSMAIITNIVLMIQRLIKKVISRKGRKENDAQMKAMMGSPHGISSRMLREFLTNIEDRMQTINSLIANNDTFSVNDPKYKVNLERNRSRCFLEYDSKSKMKRYVSSLLHNGDVNGAYAYALHVESERCIIYVMTSTMKSVQNIAEILNCEIFMELVSFATKMIEECKYISHVMPFVYALVLENKAHQLPSIVRSRLHVALRKLSIHPNRHGPIAAVIEPFFSNSKYETTL